jgi:hypothetical protein
MYVDAIESDGDDRQLRNILFRGRVVLASGEDTSEEISTWRGDIIEVRIPKHGYYSLPGMSGPVYLSYLPQNRTNRRGLDPRTIMINGRAKSDLRRRQINTLFNQCEFPGQFSRDLCVHNNNLLWKGILVGTLVNGDVTILNQYQQVRDLICEQLGKFLTVRQVTVQ